MCGIAGVIGARAEGPVNEMCACIEHRGPDDKGTIHGENVSLGMQRLSIVDLDGGDQPIENEDGSVWIVFNGEVYNQHSLRSQLSQKGHQFKTRTDTEVIVHGYEEWGTDVLDRLNGMFAFAIWDRDRDQVMVARDRLGIKPFYYAETDDAVIFASELTPLLEHPDVDERISETAVQQYSAFRYVPAPNTILEDVNKLRPGTYAVVSLAEPGLSSHRYWSLDSQSTSPERSIRELLESSVENRLMADVPLGAFLSGGLDSTTIVALMNQVSEEPIDTFSIGFANSKYDESEYSRLVADELGTNHHELTVDADSMSIFDDVVARLDEPLADPAAIPTYLLSEYAVNDVKVVLTGEGSDELFAGYQNYERFTNWWNKAGNHPGIIYTASEAASKVAPSGTTPERYLRYLSSHREQSEAFTTTKTPEWDGFEFRRSEVRDSVKATVDGAYFPGDSFTRNMLRFTQQYPLPDDLLTKVDRMTMSNSLEARVPFLDHRLVERVNAIQADKHIENGTKPVLRRAVRDIVPTTVLERQKHGFSMPIAEWFAKPLDSIEAVFNYQVLDSVPFVHPEKALSLFERHQSGHADISEYLWRILIYVKWYRKNIQNV